MAANAAAAAAASMDRVPSSSSSSSSRQRHAARHPPLQHQRTQHDLPSLKDRVFTSIPDLRTFLDSISGTDGTLLYQASRQGNRSESDTPTRVEYSCRGNTGSELPCSYTLIVEAEDTVPRSSKKQYRICNVLDKHSCPKGRVEPRAQVRARMRGQPSTPAAGGGALRSASVAVATVAAVPAATTSQARSLQAPARAVIDLTLWNPYEEEDEEDEEDEILYRDDHRARRDGGQHLSASLATNLLDQRNNIRDAQTRSHNVKPSIARHRRRSSTPLPEPDWHLAKKIKRGESTSSSSTIVVSRSVRRDVGRAPPPPSSISPSSTPSSSSAGPSSSSIQHRRSIKRESPASVSSSAPRAIPTASNNNDDNDIEFISISQKGTPLSSLNLPAHILQFCKEANVLTTERFLSYGLEKEEMGRFKELVEDWLEEEGKQGRGGKATGRDFEGVVGTLKMERIFKTVRNR